MVRRPARHYGRRRRRHRHRRRMLRVVPVEVGLRPPGRRARHTLRLRARVPARIKRETLPYANKHIKLTFTNIYALLLDLRF